MDPAHRQGSYSVRFDWGLSGAAAIAEDADIAVVVDVLSFTTTLTVAADLGAEVFPYRSKDKSAVSFAGERGATLAVGRRAAGPGDVSLSPATIRDVAPRRLVLPSPNGSTIAHHLAASSSICIGASLRNAAAVGDWITSRHNESAVVAVVAGGEKWPDGTLRPAIEDLWGAGAVIASLGAFGVLSPEAQVAAAAWSSAADRLPELLRTCASGRELIDGGFASDVTIAAEVDQSRSVPTLRDAMFVPRPD